MDEAWGGRQGEEPARKQCRSPVIEGRGAANTPRGQHRPKIERIDLPIFLNKELPPSKVGDTEVVDEVHDCVGERYAV